MSHLNQIQMRFVPVEDRVLLRINTTDRSEFRFWMTRRYVRLLSSVLSRLLASHPQVQSAADPHAKRTIMEFHHEHALQQANFSRPFQSENHRLPLGEAPVLLSRVQVKAGADGRQVLCLHPEQGQGMELALTQNLLHAFTRLLAETVTKADWDIATTSRVTPLAPPQHVTVN